MRSARFSGRRESVAGWLALCAAAGLLVAPSAFAGSQYSVATISGPGAAIQQGEALNAGGDAVGMGQFGGSGPSDCGFLWSSGTLAALPPAYTSGGPGAAGCAGAGSGDDTAWDVNDAGLIAGSSDFLASVGTPARLTRYTEAVTWQGTSSPTPLGSNCVDSSGLPGGSQAFALNAAGRAVGTTVTTCPSLQPSVESAWLGSPSNVIAPGSMNSGGKGDAQGIAVNSLGQVVVYYDGANTGGARPSAALYPGPAALPVVPTIVFNGGSARAGPGSLNDSSVVVGAVMSGSGTGATLSAGYSQNAGSAVGLPPVAGMADATASAINNHGDVVGASFTGTSGSVATIWPGAAPPAPGPVPTGVDLNTLLPPSAGITLQTAIAINASGQILAAGSTAGGAQWVVLTPLADGVTISSGNPVPEPATGSVPATFTITLPQAGATAVTITYKTIAGTATAAANDYTAVPNPTDTGTVTIPAGTTSIPVQVQVNAGSGQSTTATKAFQVQLTSSTGPPISPTGAVAPQTITLPGIGGRLTDDAGNPVAGSQVTLTGTASTGQAVNQQASTGASGAYQFYVDPGTYTITPAPPPGGRGNPMYDAITCPGSVQSGRCANIPLAPSVSLTANFKVIALVVNSTATTADATQATAGVCDVTPSAAQSTCTLPQAIEVSNQLGGRVIGFDIPGGGVPVITSTIGMPGIAAPATIDGSTQPRAHKVEINDGTENAADPNSFAACYVTGPIAGLRVRANAHGSTIRGMVIYGFRDQIDLQGGSDTIQGNLLGTDSTGQIAAFNNACNPQSGVYIESGHNQIGGTGPGSGNLISGNDTTSNLQGVNGAGIFSIANPSAGGNVIQGNTIGPPLGGKQLLLPEVPCVLDSCDQLNALTLQAGGDTVGGTAPGAGNLLVGDRAVVNGPGAVVQGNTVNVSLSADGGVTVGGATATPGSAPGNDFSVGDDVSLQVGDDVVVQGNRFHDHGSQILLAGDHSTIGGAKPELGNLVTNSAATVPNPEHLDAGISVGENLPGNPQAAVANDNTIKNNQIENNTGDGGVAVYNGTGNTITANRMRANTLGITLGGAPFFYNGARRQGIGPNDNEPYPLLFTAAAHGQTDITGKLFARGHRSYAIELYSQATCRQDSVTPGQGERYLGRQSGVRTDALGEATFKLSFSRPPAGPGNDAVTATAIAPDGSTSEFSPCLTIGHKAPSFSKNGVPLKDSTVNVQHGTSASSSPDLATSAAKKKHRATVPTATVHPFCPPITTRSCTGTITLRTIATHGHRSITVAHVRFKLAPGQLATITFRVPKSVLKLARRVHRLKILATVTAHDGAKHTRRRVRKLALTLSRSRRARKHAA